MCKLALILRGNAITLINLSGQQDVEEAKHTVPLAGQLNVYWPQGICPETFRSRYSLDELSVIM